MNNSARHSVSRRAFLLGAGARPSRLALSTFQADVTPPIGSPLFTRPARSIVDPLDARGIVLHGAGSPVVVLAIDWCEIRNNSYDLWRDELARAAATTRDRVILSAVHQHDAPYTDSYAQQLMDESPRPVPWCDPAFERQAVKRVADSLRRARSTGFTHIGMGQARVREVASNRRYVLPGGKVSFARTSATRDPAIRAMPAGLIDPWLKMLSFWDGTRPVAALAAYSTHPMSHYGNGDVTCDFPGLARNQLQREMPDVFHLYASGASGDTTAGKYNDGDPANRPALTARMHRAMRAAWETTRRVPLTAASFRSVPLRLAPRQDRGFRPDEMRATLADPQREPRDRWNAALGLSWRARLDEGRPIDVPALHLGPARLLLLPAESFVQYQLWAQQEAGFVVTVGYGECAPGYIPTRREVREGYDDYYSWVDLDAAEPALRAAIRQALRG